MVCLLLLSLWENVVLSDKIIFGRVRKRASIMCSVGPIILMFCVGVRIATSAIFLTVISVTIVISMFHGMSVRRSVVTHCFRLGLYCCI